MSLANIRQKAKLKPPIIVLYGPGGIGKTSFGATMNKPIIVQAEDVLLLVDLKPEVLGDVGDIPDVLVALFVSIDFYNHDEILLAAIGTKVCSIQRSRPGTAVTVLLNS